VLESNFSVSTLWKNILSLPTGLQTTYRTADYLHTGLQHDVITTLRIFTAIEHTHCLFAKHASQSFSFDLHFLVHWKDSNKCHSTLTFALFFCNDVIDWKKDPFFFFSLQKRTGCCNNTVSFCITHLLGDTSKDLPKPHLIPISLMFFYSHLYSDN